MTIELDAKTGVTRLDEAGVDALFEAAATPGFGADALAATALASGHLDAAMAAIAVPVARVSVATATADRVLRHRIWVGESTLALLLDGPRLTLFADRRDFLAAGLAQLVDLRPHRVEERWEVRVASDSVTAWFAADREARRSALAAADAVLAWEITVREGEDVRRLLATDGQHGIRLHEDGTLVPATNTAVFRALTAAVPTAG